MKFRLHKIRDTLLAAVLSGGCDATTRMKRTILAWIIFFCGFAVEMAADHMLRIQDGDVQTGGIPEPLWFVIQLALSMVALWLAFTATQTVATPWKRALLLSAQAAAGFLLYAFIGLYYVVGTGIDSL